jgi:hypothetical protein
MMKGGAGASDKPLLESRAAALGLKVAQAEAVAAYRANHAAAGHITTSPSPKLSNGSSSSSEAALALDAAYTQRLTDFMADVKFKATDHVNFPHSPISLSTPTSHHNPAYAATHHQQHPISAHIHQSRRPCSAARACSSFNSLPVPRRNWDT